MLWFLIFTLLIALAFTAFALSRYLERGGGHFFFWGIGLFFYTLAIFSEVLLHFFYAQAFARLWYLSGAILTAAWLGQGSLSLLFPFHFLTRLTSSTLIFLSVVAALSVTAMPVDLSNYQGELISLSYPQILERSAWSRVLTMGFNSYGVVLLLSMFVYATFLYWRSQKNEIQILFSWWFSLLLFTIGTMIPAIGSVLIQKGLGKFLPLTEFLGILFMFSAYMFFAGGERFRKRNKEK